MVEGVIHQHEEVEVIDMEYEEMMRVVVVKEKVEGVIHRHVEVEV